VGSTPPSLCTSSVLLLREDVHHVVDGDHAEQLPVRAEHRQRVEVVLGHHLRDLFLVGLGDDGDDVLGHHVAHQLVRRREQQIAQRRDAAQPVRLRDDVDVIDGLGLAGARARSRSIAPPTVMSAVTDT
jgi:hypothetical protein